MNKIENTEHALLVGVVMGTLRRASIPVDVILNNDDDITPYLHVQLDEGLKALIVVMPPE